MADLNFQLLARMKCFGLGQTILLLIQSILQPVEPHLSFFRCRFQAVYAKLTGNAGQLRLRGKTTPRRFQSIEPHLCFSVA